MEVFNWRQGEPDKAILAEFTLRIPAIGLTIHGMKAFRSKKGGLYVKFPQKGKKEPNGETTWHPIVEIDKAREAEFSKKCLEAIDPYVKMSEQKKSFGGDLF